MRHDRAIPTRAFTLLEVILVVVLLGILAGIVMPGLGSINDQRGGAGFDEVMRSLRYARASALASGTSTGVRFRTAGDDRIDLVRVDPDLSVTTTVLGPLGTPMTTRYIGADYGGVVVNSVLNGDGSSTTDETIWFAFDGTPHTRDAFGTYVADNTAAARIELAWGSTVSAVLVQPGSGYIEEE